MAIGCQRFQSLHIGGGKFQLPLMQAIIGFPTTLVPWKQTKNAVSPCKNTFPFMGSWRVGHTPIENGKNLCKVGSLLLIVPNSRDWPTYVRKMASEIYMLPKLT